MVGRSGRCQSSISARSGPGAHTVEIAACARAGRIADVDAGASEAETGA